MVLLLGESCSNSISSSLAIRLPLFRLGGVPIDMVEALEKAHRRFTSHDLTDLMSLQEAHETPRVRLYFLF